MCATLKMCSKLKICAKLKIKIVMKCLLRIPPGDNFGRNLNYKKLLRILEITDFLQMDSLTSYFQLLLSAKFTKENIHEIANKTETFFVPDLHKKCCVFIREFIPCIEVKKISKTFLQNILLPSLELGLAILLTLPPKLTPILTLGNYSSKVKKFTQSYQKLNFH